MHVHARRDVPAQPPFPWPPNGRALVAAAWHGHLRPCACGVAHALDKGSGRPLASGMGRSVQQDRPSQNTHTFVSIAIEIGAIDISSSRGVFAYQGACRHGWARLVSQLPLFCNTRITGITADGAQLGCGSTPGCVRLLFAFFTGSSDLGCHRTPIRQRHQTGLFCVLFL